MARDSSVAVAGMVCGALFHRAAERGLEFTITGPFGQDQELDRRLGLTGGWECLFLIGIGYPTEETY
jgi:hypothetical protein